MEPIRPLNIRKLKDGELYLPFYRGECIDKNGKKYFFNNPVAITLYRLWKLKTDKEKLDFFTYAYLRELIAYNHRLFESELLTRKWNGFKEKYGMPWSGQTKHVIPDECLNGYFFNDQAYTGKSVNYKVLRKMYDRMADYNYVLYP